ncbi:MAG: D-alanine--D-alanine ligase [Proteobacteria bacterium]|nr:D-alanine--D-alanine ligase [Pseudomonadota bacterium]MBU1389025.1 D-alanine--D-alanine ligase [Pseudomonadota bacterium]MBU1543577.1 D-alanine--D-alanine ligase [Pseudomonadota bacterium]MBU2429678.1 D-alanine--D-alanine ligase [Pseudomonadota bacterium]MBU2481437.1 D-alanine--D-alanine ligase [Pseudomonadota bacterium]
MKKIRLALLSGGVSSEREVSLNSGRQVLEALDKNKYDITGYDPKTDLKQLVMDADKIDAALIILHGPFGEDGTVQGLLDLLDIPYQGAGVLGSSMAMNKLVAKRLYDGAQIPTPPYLSFFIKDDIKTSDIIDTLGLPLVVKPACAGSSMGMTIVKNENTLDAAITLGFKHDDCIVIEKYIKGIELTCGVLGNDDLKALPVIEIIPGEGHEYFDYTAKYVAGETQEICPARIDDTTTRNVQQLAIQAHRALFLKGYSRTDFILFGNELTVLETNTIPGMTATSLFPQSAQAAGYSFSRLLDELIQLSVQEHEKLKLRRSV